jgi:spore germination protein GerM
VEQGEEKPPPSSAREENRLRVYLFFQSVERNLLVPEEGEIFRTENLADQAKQVLELLIRGPSGPGVLPTLPEETRLRELFIIGEDLIVVDLNREILRSHPGGVWAEMASVYSIVNSLTFNFPSIRWVKFLINGDEAESLAGHVSLARPFLMDLSIVGQPLSWPSGEGAVGG